ncbi:MAG: O-methyltransferase [Candidatus Limnocylindrales bacterium]
MASESWALVDEYLNERLVPSDDALEAAVKAGIDAGMPQIQVPPTQGKFLYLLARMLGARRILEIGTLAGYSTIWLGRALPPDGRLVSLEVNPAYAEVARADLRRARLDGIVEVRVGQALDSLAALAEEGVGPFDLVFVDADRDHLPDYVAWGLRLSRPGTVIVVDNVVRHGAVIDQASADANIQGIRRMFDLVAAEPRLEATALQTVGVKGHDGFAMLRVTS